MSADNRGEESQHLGSNYLRPPPDTIFDHQIFSHWGGYIDHVVSVGLFAHARLPVAADREAEIFLPC
jgi:hypothetical protein